MIEKLFVVYSVIWVACAVGTALFFWRRDPEFKVRWHRRVTTFNIVVIGGMILALTALMAPPWWILLLFIGAFFFIGWVSIFQTRVCGSCGKYSQPENLITAQIFCSKCGAKLSKDAA